uniref:Calcipressin-2 n=1 Tax=Steinernema glaseri TaxID=37863 RepID=A0A1I7Z7C8_9BILA
MLGAGNDSLPTAIIVTNVPTEVFANDNDRQNFCQLFTQIEEHIHFDFLKSFQRVRVIFSTPENATAAKLLVGHHSFHGAQMKAFFSKKIEMAPRSYQDEQGHLKLPPLEKQFLISPPASPPVGWEQTTEMAPVVCNFDLMSRLAALTVEDTYKVHDGDDSLPTIMVHPCKEEGDDDDSLKIRVDRPHTPRPPMPEECK